MLANFPATDGPRAARNVVNVVFLVVVVSVLVQRLTPHAPRAASAWLATAPETSGGEFRCGATGYGRWGGWGSNPRLADYESAALTD